MRTRTRTLPRMLRVKVGVRPSLAGVMTRGNEEFRAVEVGVERGGFAGVPGGLSTNCLGVLCRARHLALQTGEAFVCECRASSQGKTVGARVESREPYTEAGRLQLAARTCREVNWSSGQLGAQRAKRRAVSVGGSGQLRAECGMWNAECGMRKDKRGVESREPRAKQRMLGLGAARDSGTLRYK